MHNYTYQSLNLDIRNASTSSDMVLKMVLDAFAKFRKATIIFVICVLLFVVRPSVLPHGTIRLQLDGL